MTDKKIIAIMMTLGMLAAAFAGCLGGEDDPEPVPEDVMGCMDATANNYNADATADDGSCTYDATTTTLKVGFMNPLTGPIAVFAPAFTDSMMLAKADLNAMAPADVVIEIIEVDSGCDGTVAAGATQSLVDAGVVVIAGAVCSGGTMASIPVAQAAGVPMISYASTSPAITGLSDDDYLFRVVPSDGQQVQALSAVANDNGFSNPGILYMTNDYGAGLKDGFVASFGDVCTTVGYDQDATDFAGLVSQIADGGCDSVALFSYAVDGAAILEEMSAQDLDIPVFGAEGVSPDELSDVSAIDGMIVTQPRSGGQSDAADAFDAAYAAANGADGGIYHHETYDAVMIAGKAALAAHAAGSDDLRAHVRAVGTNYVGTSGTHTFDANGDVAGSGYLVCEFTVDAVAELYCYGQWILGEGLSMNADAGAAPIMDQYEDGEMTYAEAWTALEGVRACVETGSNNPCEIVSMGYGDAATLDPHDAYDSASGDIIENVYDTLYRYEGDGDGNAIIVPRLATGYTVSDDMLTYTFTLRDDVHFSNGDSMTAEDVVYSWTRVNEYGAPESHVAWITQQNFETSGLTYIDDTHFSVTLMQPYAGFVSTIAYTVGAVVNMDMCEANRVVTADDPATTDADESSDDWCHGWMDEAPLGAGTGAYILDTWSREDKIILTPNWMHWDAGNFNINKFTEMTNVDESNTRLLAFTDGEADFGALNFEDLPNFCYIDANGNGMFDAGEDDALDDKPNIASKDGYICTYRESFTITLAALNLDPNDANEDPILNYDTDGDGVDDANVMANPNVRTAIAYAFDYDTARRTTYDNNLAPVYGPIPNGFLYDESQYEVFTYDLTYAESLLEDAGFTRQYDCAELANNNTVVVPVADRNGDECRLPSILRIMANEGNDYRIAMAAQIAQSLGSIGVATDGDAKPWAEYLDMYYTGTFEIRFSGWAPDYLDPDNYWSPFAASSEDVYGTGYNNAALDDLLQQAKVSTDDAERLSLYSQAFDLWVEDPNMIIIGQGNGIGAKHNDICSAPWAAIGSAHWFDYDKLPMVDGALVGSCS